VLNGRSEGPAISRRTAGGNLVAFMRPAHESVPVAALPELDNGGFSIATILSQNGAPVPPAPIGVSPPARQERITGIDGWLLDRLFGGRHQCWFKSAAARLISMT
jgi:penicillin-binding protein 1A